MKLLAHTAMTNLSGAARTSAYLADIIQKNAQIQKAGGKGFFWNSKEAAETAIDPLKKKIEV